jgi:malate dehydrogenase (oxaloacetate-decarboxylating)
MSRFRAPSVGESLARSQREPAAPTGPMVTRLRGEDVISQGLLNKGTAFTDDERTALGLRGLLPARVTVIEDQVALELEHVRRKSDDLERYIGLAALQDRNETLFYRLLGDNLEEFLPVVYTPTVGRACQDFSHILRRPRGVWITPDDVDRIDEILRTGARGEVRLIVVTDNERILGLGDQGAGGIAIPIGKLALYSAAAGIHPAWTLPVSLDVGTDRADLLADPLYLGYRAPRLRGAAYDQVLEAFVDAVERVYPAAIVQWEDFKQHNAMRVLERYRHRLPSFNDDIQGTAAVVLAGLLAARRREASLERDRFLFIGAGAAAMGIAGLLRRHLALDSRTETGAPVMALMDSGGLVHLGRPGLADDQRPFALDPGWFRQAGLTEGELADPVAIARVIGASVLIGTTGGQGAFSEALVREVARHAAIPIVLPLSNPSDRSEASPEDILAWTGGRALVATGGPGRAVVRDDGVTTIGQANNVFVFPGVGLAAIVAGATEVTDAAFLVAAGRLAELVTDDRLSSGGIYPPIHDLRSIARAIAIAVVGHLRSADAGHDVGGESIEGAVDRAMWQPAYRQVVAD